jgi:photosystem II stability/assembly factor-like uncharacterized protein
VFVALDNLPGGALLSVWVAPDASKAYLAGGYLGVDPANLADRNAAGRLMRYSQGRFETVCRTPNVLWWVTAIGTTVWASGENGTVLRYTEGGMCESLDIGGMYPMGKPTLWGILAQSATEVRFVGGSPLPDGPRGVLLLYDGARFVQETIPAPARAFNLYKISQDSAGLTVVGANAVILRRTNAGATWETQSVTGLGADNTLFTVSCVTGGTCAAVGGAGAGQVLFRRMDQWSVDPISATVAGLSGVWLDRENRGFVVGRNGTTLFYNGTDFYRPPTNTTINSLHAVHGSATLVMAVGGELDTPLPTQRGTVLLRGETRTEFVFDGVTVRAVGSARPNL